MTGLVRELAKVPPWLLLLAVFSLPALEASTWFGLVVPGEIAVLAGGAFAHEGRVPLIAVMVAAALGAITGDSVGYLLGTRLGPAIFARASDSAKPRIARAQAFVQRFGGRAVLLGRWVAGLRALVPSIAGAGGLPYRRFVVFNVAGGILWAVAMATAGFLSGEAFGRVQRDLGAAGLLGALVLVVLGCAWWLRRRRVHG